jgi:hypothetical protein
MMYITKVISSKIEKAKRIIKFIRLGKDDVQTSMEIGPYGIDSNPIKDMQAIYGETSIKGETVIIGYINKNQMAQPGELRLYSTDANGQEKFVVWLKNDGLNGSLQLGGVADNLVRYNALDAGLQAYVLLINAELAKIATATAGAYVPAFPPLNISASKINEIKTL